MRQASSKICRHSARGSILTWSRSTGRRNFVEAMQRGVVAWDAARLRVVDLAALAGGKIVVAGGLRRQRHDALRDAVEVDRDLHRPFLLVLLLLLGVGLRGRFLVALLCHRRDDAL